MELGPKAPLELGPKAPLEPIPSFSFPEVVFGDEEGLSPVKVTGEKKSFHLRDVVVFFLLKFKKKGPLIQEKNNLDFSKVFEK